MALGSRRHPRTGAVIRPVGVTRNGRVVWPILGGDGTDPTPLERINALVEIGFPNLTAEQRTELRGLLSAERDAIRSATEPVDVSHIRHVTEIAQGLRAEDDRIAAAATEADDARSALDAALADPAAAPAAEVDPAAAAATTDPAAAEAATTTATTTDPAAAAAPAAAAEAAPAAVAASAAPAAPVRPTPLAAVVQTAQQHREPGNGQRPGVVAALVASAGQAAGQRLNERTHEQQLDDMADAFDTAFRDLRVMRGGGAGRIPVLASRWSLGGPTLRSENDWGTNRRLMDEAYRSALTADVTGGGICRPVTVDYSVPTWSNVEEPVKAALPAIDAPRGGLQFGLPVPYDATVYEEGISIWSEPNDRNPGGANTGPLSNPTGTGPATKPCVSIDCGQFTEVDVEAITKCAEVGNFRSRFSPENMAVLMDYLQQAFVSVAERERLKQMRAASKHVTTAAVMGFSRDLLNFYDKLRAYYRSRYRLSDNVPLRIVQNAYVRDLVRIDLRKAAFPYEAGPGAPATSLDISDAEIDAMFMRKGLTPVWTLDDDTGDQTFAAIGNGTPGSPATFPTFPAGGTSNTVKVRALVYPEGTFQRLDGGELNLGVVRDSALNAQNRYQIFAEIFEAVAMRGFESHDWEIDAVVDGSTSGTMTPPKAI